MDEFSTLSVTVTEEINFKKLPAFIQTQIKLHNIFVTKESYYYYCFIAEALRYEIIVFREKNSIFKSGIFFLSKFNCKGKYTLFILENLFCVYKKEKPLFIKKVSNISEEDIKSYIQQTYNITPFNVKYLDKQEIENLVKNSDEKSKKTVEQKLYQIGSTNTFKYFIYYSFTIFIVCFFLVYDKVSSRYKLDTRTTFNKSKYTQEFISYTKHKKDKNLQILINFLNYLQKYNIKLKAIKYINNRTELHLLSVNKELLLKLLEYPNKKIELQSIQLEEISQVYLMKVILYG